jgi:hypothetical protein
MPPPPGGTARLVLPVEHAVDVAFPRRYCQARHATIPDPEHVSEVTSWLRRTQLHTYLRDLHAAAAGRRAS